jgi:hypothetical protein
VCADVFREVEASVPDGVPSPQPLYWRAQCSRMLGHTRESLPDYARAVRDSAPVAAAPENQDRDELTLAMNAFQGMGAALIAAKDIAESEPGVADALATAREQCTGWRAYQPRRSARMALALACLDKAVELRVALKQTPNQIARSREYLSFAHLRDGDYAAAYANAAQVEDSALLQRNEVVRALSAAQVKPADPNDARQAAADAAEARRNVSFFRATQFNVCELQALLTPPMFEEASRIIAAAHPGEEVRCARGS